MRKVENIISLVYMTIVLPAIIITTIETGLIENKVILGVVLISSIAGPINYPIMIASIMGKTDGMKIIMTEPEHLRWISRGRVTIIIVGEYMFVVSMAVIPSEYISSFDVMVLIYWVFTYWALGQGNNDGKLLEQAEMMMGSEYQDVGGSVHKLAMTMVEKLKKANMVLDNEMLYNKIAKRGSLSIYASKSESAWVKETKDTVCINISVALLLNSDSEIRGTLYHEIGHVKHRRSYRVAETIVIYALLMVLSGYILILYGRTDMRYMLYITWVLIPYYNYRRLIWGRELYAETYAKLRLGEDKWRLINKKILERKKGVSYWLNYLGSYYPFESQYYEKVEKNQSLR